MDFDPVRSLAFTLSILCFLYGVYTVLFLVCIRILLKQERCRYLIHCFSMSALFIFATVSLVYNAGDAVAHALGLSWGSAVPAQWIITLLANITADAILIWRCHTVWNGCVIVIVIPTILCIATSVLRIFILVRYSLNIGASLFTLLLLSESHQKGYEAIHMILVLVFFTAFTNLLLTLIIAGRIYFIKRKASSYVGKTVNKMYRTVIAIVIESGIMYPLALIIYAASVLIVFSTSKRTSDRADKTQHNSQLFMLTMQSVLNQIIGIAPTLIIVRMGLGISVERAEQTIPTHTDAEPDLKEPGEWAMNVSPRRRQRCKCGSSDGFEGISAKVELDVDVER